jgi:hypothetical protein
VSKLNVAGMAAIETEKAKRTEKIRTLISDPFDYTNEKQINSLKQVIDNFEYNVNQMYIYQALTNGIIAWGASFLFARILPIPDIVNSLLNACFVLGLAGHLLEKYSITDFHAQLSEMKQLYNWCLKNGSTNYNEHDADNTNNLLNPQIQRMIKLIAPLCSTEFMLAWPRETAHTEQNNGYISSVFSFGYSVVSAPLSLFSKSTQPSGDQQLQLRELKASIETRKLDLNDYTGFKQAIDYFMTQASHADYKKFLWTKWDDLKAMAPTPIAAMLTSPKLD